MRDDATARHTLRTGAALLGALAAGCDGSSGGIAYVASVVILVGLVVVQSLWLAVQGARYVITRPTDDPLARFTARGPTALSVTMAVCSGIVHWLLLTPFVLSRGVVLGAWWQWILAAALATTVHLATLAMVSHGDDPDAPPPSRARPVVWGLYAILTLAPCIYRAIGGAPLLS